VEAEEGEQTSVPELRSCRHGEVSQTRKKGETANEPLNPVTVKTPTTSKIPSTGPENALRNSVPV
jgi:hypothetical protein